LQKAGMVCVAPEEEQNMHSANHTSLRNIVDKHKVVSIGEQRIKPAARISDAWAYR